MESSGNTRAKIELALLISDDEDLTWPKQEDICTDLIDIAIESKNKKIIDQLSQLINHALYNDERTEHRALKYAWSYIVDQIMERELEKKYPNFSKRIGEEIKMFYEVS